MSYRIAVPYCTDADCNFESSEAKCFLSVGQLVLRERKETRLEIDEWKECVMKMQLCAQTVLLKLNSEIFGLQDMQHNLKQIVSKEL